MEPTKEKPSVYEAEYPTPAEANRMQTRSSKHHRRLKFKKTPSKELPPPPPPKVMTKDYMEIQATPINLKTAEINEEFGAFITHETGDTDSDLNTSVKVLPSALSLDKFTISFKNIINEWSVPDSFPTEVGKKPIENGMVQVLDHFQKLYPEILQNAVNLSRCWQTLLYITPGPETKAYVPGVFELANKIQNEIANFIAFYIEVFGRNKETEKEIKMIISEAVKVEIYTPAKGEQEKPKTLEEYVSYYRIPLDPSLLKNNNPLYEQLEENRKKAETKKPDLQTLIALKKKCQRESEHPGNVGTAEKYEKFLTIVQECSEIWDVNAISATLLMQLVTSTLKRSKELLLGSQSYFDNVFGSYRSNTILRCFYLLKGLDEKEFFNPDEILHEASRWSQLQDIAEKMMERNASKIALEIMTYVIQDLPSYRGCNYQAIETLYNAVLANVQAFDSSSLKTLGVECRRVLSEVIHKSAGQIPPDQKHLIKQKAEPREDVLDILEKNMEQARNEHQCAKALDQIFSYLIGYTAGGEQLRNYANCSIVDRNIKIEALVSTLVSQLKGLKKEEEAHERFITQERERFEKEFALYNESDVAKLTRKIRRIEAIIGSSQ